MPVIEADRLLPEEPVRTLAAYEARGGGEAIARLHDLGPDWALGQLRDAGLRGRGGGGFPTATKWASVRAGGPEVGERFVVANGAEGEPGTFKDRSLLRRNPFQVLEGVVVAARVVGARRAFVAVKASFTAEIDALDAALGELATAGWTDGLEIALVGGPDEYLFGEETALLEVIEGEDPLPRLLPPYLYGLFSVQPQMGWSAAPVGSAGNDRAVSNPTVVNDVETFANVAPILAHGPAWFRQLGTDESPGSLLCTVSGDTRRAGVAEIPLGTPLSTAIHAIGGGMPDGRRVKAVLSGVANPVLAGAQLDTPLTYEAMTAVGTGLGAAGFLVFDDRRDMVRVAHAVSRFLYVESCGQCPACKFGTGEVTGRLEQLILEGGTEGDVETIAARLRQVTDANRCYLGTEEQRTVGSILAAFPEDVALALTGVRTEPVEPISKIVDIADGEAVVDERQARKRPDWTYGDTVPEVFIRRRHAG